MHLTLYKPCYAERSEESDNHSLCVFRFFTAFRMTGCMIKIKETMIQRIQSVYLLVVTILIIICLCSPVGSYIGSDYSVSALTNLCLTMADGTKDYAPWALFVILLVVAVLAFGTIFLFKKRMLQIRLTIFSTILLIGYYATLVTFIFMLKEESMTFSPSWTVCLPLVAIILNWLAIRAIGKDEVLVKAYDRLR